MNKHFCIGIPTVNQHDMLMNNISKYVTDFPGVYIFIINNNKVEFDNMGYGQVRVFNKGFNVGVSASWNQICYEGFHYCDNVLILNDDIYLGRGVEEIECCIDEYPDAIIKSPKGYCAFILSKYVHDKVGIFDTSFYPAYFEDNDFDYRCRLSNQKMMVNEVLNPLIFNSSMSIKKDPSLNVHFEDNRKYYINKWGGEPGKETIKIW